jgi:hypothetical protein
MKYDWRGAVPFTKSISLRDAGLQLSPRPGKVAYSTLLSLLKAGQIGAGFRFTGSTAWWIKIPTPYWSTVSSDKFRAIQISRRHHSSGAFKVRLGDFAKEIVALINQNLERQSALTSKEWEAVLKATTRRYEVEIIEQEWNDFLAQNPLVGISSENKSTSGRQQKKGWRQTAIVIGAYILKHCQTTNEQIKIEEASRRIHEIAKKAKTIGLPEASTIKGALSEIRYMAEELSIN